MHQPDEPREKSVPSSSLRQLQPDPCRHPGVVEGAVVLPVEAHVGEEVEVDGFQGVVRKAGEKAPAKQAHEFYSYRIGGIEGLPLPLSCR